MKIISVVSSLMFQVNRLEHCNKDICPTGACYILFKMRTFYIQWTETLMTHVLTKDWDHPSPSFSDSHDTVKSVLGSHRWDKKKVAV